MAYYPDKLNSPEDRKSASPEEKQLVHSHLTFFDSFDTFDLFDSFDSFDFFFRTFGLSDFPTFFDFSDNKPASYGYYTGLFIDTFAHESQKRRKIMRDLSYTICSNYFFHKSLSKEQRLNGMRWDKPDSKGRIMSGSLTPDSSYSITEFITKKDFSVTYQSGSSKGYLLIINQLSNASFLQIKTQERFETDYSPREIEMIILPASKNLTVIYAPETLGKRLEIFIEESQAEALFSSSFLAVLKDEDALYFSNKMCDSCYEKLEEISRVLFKEAFAIADKFIAKRIVEMLSQFSGLAKKS